MTAPEPQAELDVAARAAFARGAWGEARDAFRAALAAAEAPEALEGLAWACWCLNEPDEAIDARERAFRLYRRAGDDRGAARTALWLASDYLGFRAEPAIASGWLQRARRLLGGLDTCAEHGWLVFHEGAVALEGADDAAAGRRAGAEAAELGRRLGVADLEVLGLALEGLALVTEGQVEEGMRRLDEAATAVLGEELAEPVSYAWTGCYLMYACERVRDYDRASQWCARLKELAARLAVRAWLGICRAHYAGVLVWRGEWGEAEEEILAALDDYAGTRPAEEGEARVRLAELRRRQGRLDEAAELLSQAHGHPLAPLVQAELALDRGDPQAAGELVERHLRAVPAESRTQRASALELLVRARAELRELAEATAALRELETVADEVATLALSGSTSYAAGLVALAGRDLDRARTAFEDAVDLLARAGGRFESARARVDLARVLASLGRADAARHEAEVAREQLAELGAARESERAASVPAAPGRPGRAEEALAGLTRREVEVLRLVADGLSDREIAATLVLSEHTVHRHVSNVLAKLRLPSRSAAVAYAAKHGLI